MDKKQLLTLSDLQSQCSDEEFENIALFYLITTDNLYFAYESKLKSEYFFDNLNRKVFEAIKVAAKTAPLKLTAVHIWQTIREMYNGTKDVFNEAIKKYSNEIKRENYNINIHESEFDFVAEKLKEAWARRQLYGISQYINSKAKDADISEIMETVNESITEMMNDNITAEAPTLQTIGAEYLIGLEKRRNNEAVGIPTGNSQYDVLTGGQIGSKLIIYAGRPGMGKSARMCNEIFHQLKLRYSVVLHNLEMPYIELFGRLVALELDCDIDKIESYNKADVVEAVNRLASYKLRIFESSKLHDIILNTKVSMMADKVDIVYVDYLQFVRVKGKEKDRVGEVEESSRAFKEMAKQYNIPFVVMAQLNRDVEQNKDKVPTLANLKNSGAIEQDADIIQFLWRPEYYKIEYFDFGNGTESTKNKAVYYTGKHRGGATIDIVLNWDGAKNRFYELYKTHKPESVDYSTSIINSINDTDDAPF